MYGYLKKMRGLRRGLVETLVSLRLGGVGGKLTGLIWSQNSDLDLFIKNCNCEMILSKGNTGIINQYLNKT